MFKKITYYLLPAIVFVSTSIGANVDDQTVIKIDGVRGKNLIVHEDIENLPIGNGSETIFTRWTPWSPCESCRQHRTMQRLRPNATWAIAEEFEERPCRKNICLRLWHKNRSRRRMRVVQFDRKHQKHVKSVKFSNNRPNRTKSSIWSKWSTWSKCTKSCTTERYKVCKKPGRCLKLKKHEHALCYLPNSLCERHVKHHMEKYNLPMWGAMTATTPKPTPHAHNARNGGRNNARAPKKYQQQCGRPLRKHRMLKIKGGHDASRGMWPWHVAVVNQHDEAFCSGTLIAPRWVLTAAHCIRARLKVRINEFDLWDNDGEIEISIERSFRHSRFNMNNIDNDIGLLYMEKSVKTPVACLPSDHTNEYETANQCTVLGWGAKDSTRYNGGYHILQEGKLPIVQWEKCKAAYYDYYISQNMFCAGYSNGKIDTCAGDSGGGLLCRTWRIDEHDPNRRRKPAGYVIQGITSFGDSCGKPHRYGIYANVSNYLNWIHHTMAQVTRDRRYHFHSGYYSKP